MASARHFVHSGHRQHPLQGYIFQNEFDYCKSGTTHTLEYMCLELQFCASSICCNSFDNVLFLSGILPQEVKETFVPRRHGTDCPHSGCRHFMNSSFHFPQELHWRGGIIANFFTAQSFFFNFFYLCHTSCCHKKIGLIRAVGKKEASQER